MRTVAHGVRFLLRKLFLLVRRSWDWCHAQIDYPNLHTVPSLPLPGRGKAWGQRGHPHRKSPSEGLASIPAQDAARTSAFPGLSPFLNQRGLLLMKMFERPPGEPMNAAQAAQKTGLHEHTTVSAHLVKQCGSSSRVSVKMEQHRSLFPGTLTTH